MSKRYFRNRYTSTSIGIAVIGLTLVLTGGAGVAQQPPTGTAAGHGQGHPQLPAATKLPAATSPGVTRPLAPGSARAGECRKMAAELGMVGTRRTRYFATCSRR
jgi:hypothetical protein